MEFQALAPGVRAGGKSLPSPILWPQAMQLHLGFSARFRNQTADLKSRLESGLAGRRISNGSPAPTISVFHSIDKAAYITHITYAVVNRE